MDEGVISSGKTAFVTGAAGFIGSTMTDRLLSMGVNVIGYDNLVTGFDEFLASARANSNFKFVRGDVLDQAALTKAMAGADLVLHFSANADVRFGLQHPRKDLEQNTIATYNVLEAMRSNAVNVIVFSSTGSIYGEADQIPTPENASLPIQTSLYGASKLAGEGLISAYAEGFAMRAFIFRFVSILGERYTHGHVFDFYKNLLADPNHLDVLGDGMQRKSYLHVEDCVDAMLVAVERANDKVNIFNLGAHQYCQVIDSIRWITDYLKLTPELRFAGGVRGWIGDNPYIFLDTAKIRALGWTPKLTIQQGVERTIAWLTQNRWVFEKRN